MKVVSVARPEDLDLAIPPLESNKGSGLTVKQIADGYSRWVTSNWARTSNVEYTAGPNGPPVSLLAQAGKVWSLGDPRWPVFLVLNNKAYIKQNITGEELKKAKFAFSTGPWLVQSGHLCNISDEIARRGYTGLRPADACERAGIGIRGDGLVVHVALAKATLDELATVMQQKGCANAIALDGGSSMCVMDNTGNVLLGSSSRSRCSALMFLQLVGEEIVHSEPQLPVVNKWARIYLSPSQQSSNRGVGDYGTEMQRMFELSYLVAHHLIRLGHDVAVAKPGLSLAEVVNDSNAWKAQLHVCLHSNANAGKGVEAFYGVGYEITRSLFKALSAINPNGGRRCVRRPNAKEDPLYEIANTDAICTYLEVGCHDVPEEAKWIVDSMGLIAQTIAETLSKGGRV